MTESPKSSKQGLTLDILEQALLKLKSHPSTLNPINGDYFVLDLPKGWGIKNGKIKRRKGTDNG